MFIPADCGKLLIYQVLPAHAALTLKRPRLRKAAVSVQVIQITDSYLASKHMYAELCITNSSLPPI